MGCGPPPGHTVPTNTQQENTPLRKNLPSHPRGSVTGKCTEPGSPWSPDSGAQWLPVCWLHPFLSRSCHTLCPGGRAASVALPEPPSSGAGAAIPCLSESLILPILVSLNDLNSLNFKTWFTGHLLCALPRLVPATSSTQGPFLSSSLPNPAELQTLVTGGTQTTFVPTSYPVQEFLLPITNVQEKYNATPTM